MTKATIAVLLTIFMWTQSLQSVFAKEANTWWEVQSIDTVKFSRDIAREKVNDSEFDSEIDKQIRLISETGATHVAIGTPYDEEFLPYLQRWVETARKYNLKVWFRGNFSGWEGWFDYEKITREQHLNLTKDFLQKNSFLFMDGDIFTACTECENGGPGDPRTTNDIQGHRNFLIDQYNATSGIFKELGKDVKTNFNSMNGDVASLIMDRRTTKALGGIVTIDHYVATPEKLAEDIMLIALSSGGKIVLGEFGVPIPDIHGSFTSEQQAAWISQAFSEIAYLSDLHGVNYWTNMGSSTGLWKNDGSPSKSVHVLYNVYTPKTYNGTVLNELGKPVAGAIITVNNRVTATDTSGKFKISYVDIERSQKELLVKASGYKGTTYKPIWNDAYNDIKIVLVKETETFWFSAMKLLQTAISFVRIQILTIPAPIIR